MSEKKKKIHVDLPEEIHQKLRVNVALKDVSIQKFVEKLITDAVKKVKIDKIELSDKSRA